MGCRGLAATTKESFADRIRRLSPVSSIHSHMVSGISGVSLTEQLAVSLRAVLAQAPPQLVVSCPVRQKAPAPTAADRASATCFPCCGGRLEHAVFSEHPSFKPPSFPSDEVLGKDRTYLLRQVGKRE